MLKTLLDEIRRAMPGYEVRYLLNWGGFENYSFTLDDGQRPYHLKLAKDPAPLRRWMGLRKVLTEYYHAPKVVSWWDRTSLQGLLFDHIDGQQPNLAGAPALYAEVQTVIRNLHSDFDLVDRLPSPGRSCFDAFAETFLERYREDLKIIERSRPPFVSDETLAWMRAESQKLRELVRGSEAFREPAERPVHGDVWENNVLISQGAWYLLDWDDLCLGDPVMDEAMLAAQLWLPDDSRGWREVAGESASAERMEVYARAILLDNVIDVLADWVDADKVPEHLDEVRTRKEAEHHKYLARYQKLWGG